MSSTSLTSQPRNALGQWAATGNREPDVAAEELLAVARRCGAKYAAKYGQSPQDGDDAAMDAVAAYLERIRANRDPADLSGRHVSPSGLPDNAAGWVNTVVRNALSKSLTGLSNGTDRKAFTAYLEQIRRFLEEHRREPTHGERERIAAAVRDAAPPGRRPAPDFWCRARAGRPVSFDDAWMAGHVPEGYEHTPQAPPGSALDATLRAAEDAPSMAAARTRVRAGLWTALSEAHGGPPVAPIGSREASLARNVLPDAAAVTEAARRVRRGEALLPERERALFAPFGALGESHRQAVADTLLAHPQYAWDVWNAAVSAASAARGKVG